MPVTCRFLRVLALCTLASSAAADDVNITFADWERSSAVVRTAYLMGIVDTLYVDTLTERGHNFHRCVQRKRRTLAALADDILLAAQEYQRRNAGFKFKTVHEAVVHYIDACPR